MNSRAPIYLNHAGTSWPKPDAVTAAATQMQQASPDQWAECFHEDHAAVAEFFHVDSSRLLLTPSCTGALSVALSDLDWQPGDRVITSSFEHHALDRCVTKLRSRGVESTAIPPVDVDGVDLNRLQDELSRGRVRLLSMTAACNVTGRLLPVERAIEIAHDFDVPVLIDGAQIAGWWDLDLIELGADLFTFAGHKGTQAPWGIGGLYVSSDTAMHCPSASCELPANGASKTISTMPGYCDAGSVNLVALAGLAAGCRWLSQEPRADRLSHARGLASEFADAMRRLPTVTIHDDGPLDQRMPTVAISIRNRDSTEFSKRLKREGVIVSGGFQCAPKAHQHLGTEREGVVRFSFGAANSNDEVGEATRIVGALVDEIT